jgi:hypothetical protein
MRAAAAAAMALAVVGAGCSSSAASSEPPRIAGLKLTPNPDSVLSGELRFTTDQRSTATLHLAGPSTAIAPMAERAASTNHDIPVVGLRAETDYTVWVTVVADHGASTTSRKLPFRTGALPADLPPIKVTSTPARMAPGVTMFDATRRGDPPKSGGVAPFLGYLIAVDAEGTPVWYHRANSPIGDARMLADGHILYEYNNMGAQEIDLLGHVVHEWAGALERGRLAKDQYGRTVAGAHATSVDFDSIHHEITPLPNGDFLTLSNELRTVTGFSHPMCGEDASKFDGSYKLITDVVIEFAPGTGKVVHRWPLTDYLHPQTNAADANICGLPGPKIYPNFLYSALGDVHDWTHANAVIYDAERNAVLVSIRHLDTILAIRYQDDASGKAGSLKWRLGDKGGDFELTKGEWFYHQHAIELQADGSFLLYDNGNTRPGTDPEAADPAVRPYSRAVRYTIDDRGPRGSWTATQEWEYRSNLDGTPLYAFFVGDTDHLANGNVLVDNGGIIDPPTGNAQITELVPAGDGNGADVVFDLRITGPGTHWFAYRSERIPSLYGPDATTPGR